MSETMSLNVRISGALRDHVMQAIEGGEYENASEYVRSLIRADRERAEHVAFEEMKAQLQLAFSAPDHEHELVSADDIRNRVRERLGR